MDRRSHWDDVYRTKGPEQVSWFRAETRLSRTLIERSAPDRNVRIMSEPAVVDVAPFILQHLRIAVPAAVASEMDGVTVLR